MTTTYGVSNYGWCDGTWYTFGGYGGVPNPSTFCTNISRTFASFTDGLSNTVLGSEVKTYPQAYHNCTSVPPPGPTGPAAYPDVPPCSPASRRPRARVRADHGPVRHARRRSFRVVQRQLGYDCFTTALPPNTLRRPGRRLSTPI